jgi:hypothetical protein
VRAAVEEILLAPSTQRPIAVMSKNIDIARPRRRTSRRRPWPLPDFDVSRSAASTPTRDKRAAAEIADEVERWHRLFR